MGNDTSLLIRLILSYNPLSSIAWLLSHLLATVRGKIENKHGEERDAHARDDEVDCVEESLASHGDVERDIKVRLITAGVELDVPNGGNCQDVPLDRHVELGQVDTDVDDVGALLFFLVSEVHLKRIAPISFCFSQVV